MIRNITIIAILLMVVATAVAATPGKQQLSIAAKDVTARTEADTTLGQFYTLPCPVPTGVGADQVERVLLELYVNVAAIERDGYLNPEPILELYALDEAFSTSLNAEKLRTSTGVARPVRVGNNRRVVLDVTGIVRDYLDGTASNVGLVAGSLTGMREGDFTLVSGGLSVSAGAVAVLHVYTSTAKR